jgi:hypothetical protein
MTSDLELRWQELQAFFLENTDHRVGSPGDQNCCPIAEFFYQKKQLDVLVSVGGEIIDQEDRSHRRPMCKWEQTFADLVDTWYEDRDEINGEQALDALNEATREELVQLQLFEEKKEVTSPSL